MENKNEARIRRAIRIRKKIKKLGVIRLVVHRTLRHIYAQVIAPNGSEVLVSASTVEKILKKNSTSTANKDAAAMIGKVIAERSLKKDIRSVSFDRSGYKYHGRVKVLAEFARKYGLQF